MGKKPFISIVNQYFNRFPFRKINIALEPSKDLKIIVVIPSYNEKNIQPTIDSLFLKQDDFSFNVEVIVLINNSEMLFSWWKAWLRIQMEISSLFINYLV
ncbi:hypothetical protein N9K77_01160 [bacterium]|nr:hypothetical protein [bacterium]